MKPGFLFVTASFMESFMNRESALPPVVPTGPNLPATQDSRPQPSRLRKVFIGSEGLRAGWSALIFILIFGAFMALAAVITKLFLGSQNAKQMQEISLKFAYLTEGLTAAGVLLATWVMAKIERRGRHYGYGGANKLQLLLAGLASGVILISLLVFILWKAGSLVIERRLIFGGDVLRYGILWLPAMILVGIFEESLSRGFLLYTLTRGLSSVYQWAFKTTHSVAPGFWTSAVILSIMFSLGHTSNPGESPVGLLSVFLGGMLFCLGVWRTGSIWWGIGMHAAWDWGQSFLFGVPDSGLLSQHRLLATHPQGNVLLSGGSTGPEGSIFVLAVLAVGWLIVVFILPRGRYLDERVGGLSLDQPASGQPSQPALPASGAV